MANTPEQKKILIFIVCYNAQAHICRVLDRIPRSFWESREVEILLIDDASPDDTVKAVIDHAQAKKLPMTVLRNIKNLGYGGNQKLGYQYAIDHGFDAVVLLHGDGQYAPEYLEAMLAPIIAEEKDIVLGSRMIIKGDALKGRMPLYKFFGNILLTGFQNLLLGSHLSEFHTGYRAYSVKTLASIPFCLNSDGFVFDTEILIQCLDNRMRIGEIAIPTFYGDEISHVKCMQYGVEIVYNTVVSRLQRLGLCYTERFDYRPRPNQPDTNPFALSCATVRGLLKEAVRYPGYDGHAE